VARPRPAAVRFRCTARLKIYYLASRCLFEHCEHRTKRRVIISHRQRPLNHRSVSMSSLFVSARSMSRLLTSPLSMAHVSSSEPFFSYSFSPHRRRPRRVHPTKSVALNASAGSRNIDSRLRMRAPRGRLKTTARLPLYTVIIVSNSST